MHKRYIIVAFLLIVSLLYNVPAESSQKKKLADNANYGNYNFSLTTLDGKKIRLADYAGKVVLVNIWAPWCGPCRMEAPGFVKLYSQYKDKGFDILGVAVKTNESDVRLFMEKYNTRWHIGINDEVAEAYGTYGLPDSYLFGPDGSLIKRFIGFAREEALKPLIEEALKQVDTSSKKSTH
ncbi:MAG: TlpA family protein disulfide reductase [Ignavibacteriae bacterium]|nr:TlpA family protein disulfide reductase [Ignavibacteriota bacterium]